MKRILVGNQKRWFSKQERWFGNYESATKKALNRQLRKRWVGNQKEAELATKMEAKRRLQKLLFQRLLVSLTRCTERREGLRDYTVLCSRDGKIFAQAVYKNPLGEIYGGDLLARSLKRSLCKVSARALGTLLLKKRSCHNVLMPPPTPEHPHHTSRPCVIWAEETQQPEPDFWLLKRSFFGCWLMLTRMFLVADSHGLGCWLGCSWLLTRIVSDSAPSVADSWLLTRCFSVADSVLRSCWLVVADSVNVRTVCVCERTLLNPNATMCTVPSFQYPNYWPARRPRSNQHPTYGGVLK